MIAAQNVLPERYVPWRFPVAATTVFAGLIALGFLSFAVTGMVSGVVGEIDPLNAKLELLELEARGDRMTAARQRVFDQRIADADLEALELEANLLSLGQEMETLLAQISDITENAGPSNVRLFQLGTSPEGYSVTGGAERHSDVLAYAASMRSSPNFEDAVVVQVGESNDSQVRFTVVVTIPTPEPEEEEPAPQAQSP